AQAGFYLGDLAVPIGENTWRSCVTSTHSAVAAANAVISGDRFAYSLCRPSGHHARADRASGFCYLNNSAIAAEHLKARFEKIAIIDVDTHHGDGTQEIFYRRPDVLTVSLHGDPEKYYPFFTGYVDETGSGEGEGFNLNVPLPARTGDEAFLEALSKTLDRVARFSPDALVIPLGYDIHRDDAIGIFDVSTGAFADIAKQIAQLGLPSVIVQEGGYQVSVIGNCLCEFLTGINS
ncbi:MAG: histone deacetylase family protein, partial [Hyphomicrobiales bacterium]